VILQRGHRLAEFEQDFAVDVPLSNSFSAARAAVAPVGHDEAAVKEEGEI
jgi:hypothetical protein